MANSNTGHMSHNEYNENFFPNSHDFGGFDAVLQNPEELSFEQGWAYQSEPMSVDQVASPNFQWQSAIQQHNSSSVAKSVKHNDLYPRSFSTTPTGFRDAASANVDNFNTYQQSQYELATLPISTATGEHHKSHNALFSRAGAQATTIAPEALQNVTAPYTNTSGASPYQEAVSARGSTNQYMYSPLPQGVISGNFIITSSANLTQETHSRPLHNFVHIGLDAQDVSITKTTIPSYFPRKSRNEIKRLLANDSRLRAKLSKTPSIKSTAGGVPRATAPRSSVIGSGGPGSLKQQAAEPTSEEESSEDESAYGSSEEETPQPPIPATRPTSAMDAVRYDTIKSLWYPPVRSASREEIVQSLEDFWEVVRTIRDRWKSDTSAVRDAEEAKKVNEIPLLKERVSRQREMLETALRSALEAGHQDVVEHLAENGPFLLLIAQFMQDRAKELDYSGKLSRVMLELLSRCKTLSDGKLEKFQIKKVLIRFAKRGDDYVKGLTKRIESNALTASRKQRESPGSSINAGTQVVQTKSASNLTQQSVSSIAGVKRLRTVDGNTDKPSKRLASDGGTINAGAAGQSKGTALLKGLAVSSKDLKTSTAVPSTAVKKAHQVIAKPSGFFSSLQSAYKKPGTSSVGAAAAQTKVTLQNGIIQKMPVTAAASPVQPSGTFSFAETMANLTKPKEVRAPSKHEETQPPETKEERTKRLRKEQRRKLRVSFKPEDSLIDVRYFTHDPEEELGHDASRVRDVGDIESEGRMFKKQHHLDQDAMDIDEDDENDKLLVTEFSRPYPPPSLVDFTDTPQADRERNYEPHGGGIQKPECAEREIQERREANTLMAIYTDPSDIPPSPKEPPVVETSQDAPPVKEFGAPPEHVLSRLATVQASSSLDLSALLGTLANQTSQQQQQQQQQVNTVPVTDLEKIFAQYATPGQQQQQQLVFHNRPQSNPAPNVQAILAGLNQHNQSAYPHAYPQQAQANMSQPDISSILASLQQPTPMVSQVSMAPMMGSGIIPDFSPQYPPSGYLQGYPTQIGQQQQPNQQYPFENPERRRWIEAGGPDSNPNDVNGFRKGGQINQGVKNQMPWNKPKNKNPPKFVVQCKYWKEGKCKKGPECTYLHD